MAKRKRTSRKPKKRTSRRNAGGWGASPLGRRPRRNTGLSRADETVRLITGWKREYMQRHGVSATDLTRAGEEVVARMHTLHDEGVPLKKAYGETVALFRKDPEPIAFFADDVAYRLFTLVRDYGLSVEQAVIATGKGVAASVANRRRRSRRR